MDKNTPVVQGFNLYVETVAKKLNSKNLDGEPLYSLLGVKKVRRKVLAGPYKSMRDLMNEVLESNLLKDEEFIGQFSSLILNAATMNELSIPVHTGRLPCIILDQLSSKCVLGIGVKPLVSSPCERVALINNT